MCHDSSTISAFYTFTPTRPLRLLALDGFSATFSGSQDLQDVLAYRHAPDGVNREFERSQVLCDWALPRGIDGFIREEAAFEVIYCDFARGIKLLDRVRTSFNSTPPEVDGEYVGHDESERWGMGRRRYDRMREVAAPGQEMQTTVYRNQSRWYVPDSSRFSPDLPTYCVHSGRCTMPHHGTTAHPTRGSNYTPNTSSHYTTPRTLLSRRLSVNLCEITDYSTFRSRTWIHSSTKWKTSCRGGRKTRPAVGVGSIGRLWLKLW